MDFKPMFPSLNVLWTRWSGYHIKPAPVGRGIFDPCGGCN